MRLGLKLLPLSGFALGAKAALGVATACATAGVCTTTVFFVPVSSHPAAFPTTRTEMPPITAATIATIARDTGRSRTDRTVAACARGVGAEDAVELRTTSCGDLAPQKAGGGRRLLTFGRPTSKRVFGRLRC